MADLSTNNSTTVTSLNDLPDQILLHIISFLPTSGDAIITSYVSRKWRNLWLSSPSLNFYHFSLSNDLETISRFTSFVDKTLIRRPPNSPLHSFRVIVDFNNDGLNSQVCSWIRYAVSHDVENLHLRLKRFKSFTQRNHNCRFEFPFYVLRDSRVRVLKLYGCDLFLPLDNARFDSLRSVTLDEVRLTDQIVADLVVGCVNLENLVLSSIQGCKDIKIRCSKLKELTVEFMKLEEGSVEVVTPNLCALNVYCCQIGNLVLNDASSLVEAYVNVGEYQYWVKLVESKDVYSECFILQNLKHVQLQTCYTQPDLIGILVLLILSPNLETMILDNCSYLTEMMSEGQMSEDSMSEDLFKQVVVNVRSLRHVKMKSFMGTECEKNLAIFLLKTAVILESIMLIPVKFGGVVPQPPIVLEPQFDSLEDLENVVSQIPRWRKQEDAY